MTIPRAGRLQFCCTASLEGYAALRHAGSLALVSVQLFFAALQALKQEGVQQFNPEGEKFDPNYHSALFEMVDPSKEPGQIGQVTKVGGSVRARTLRCALCLCVCV